jgi:hypothetical protein
MLLKKRENKEVFKSPVDLLQEDINEAFKRKEKNDLEVLFQVLSLILYKNENNTDLIELLNTVGIDTFSKIIHLFGGRAIELPTEEDFSAAMVLSMSYYYRKIEGIKDWEKIQAKLPAYKLDKLSLSLRIHRLDSFLKQKIQQIFRQMKSKKNKGK